MPQRLSINLDDVLTALDNGTQDSRYYLDLESGDVVLISSDTRKNLDDMYDELVQYEEDGPWAIQQHLEDRGFSPAEQAGVLAAFLIDGGYGLRYREMPRVSANAVERDMQDFAMTVQNEECAAALKGALEGRGIHRSFGQAISGYPAEREQWTHFREERARRRALTWLDEAGIEPVLS